MTEASGFNPESDVQKLREAMKGAGESGHVPTGKENVIRVEFLAIFLFCWKVGTSVLLPLLPWQLKFALLTASPFVPRQFCQIRKGTHLILICVLLKP